MPGLSRDVLIRVLSETSGATKAQKALKAFEAQEKRAAKAAEALNKNLNKTTRLSKELVAHQDSLHRMFGRLAPTVERLTLAYDRLANKLGAVKMGLVGLIGAGGVAQGMRIAHTGMQFQSSLDQSLARLTAEIRKDGESWNKSRARADKLIKWGIQYKIKTPYSLDQIMETLSGMAILYRGDIEKAKRATEIAALLASKNPRQGLMGAFISLQEAESGYMMSPMRRFNLPKNILMKYYKQTGSGLEAIAATLKELRVNEDLMFKVTETMPGLEHQIQNLYKLVYGELMEGIFKARREHLRFVRDRMREMLNERSTAHKLIKMSSDLMGRVAKIYYRLLEIPVRFADSWLPILRNFSRALDPLIANITAFGKGIMQGFVLPFKAFLNSLSVAGKIMRPFMSFFSAFTGRLGKVLGSPAYAGVPIARMAGTAMGMWLSAKMTGRAIGYMRSRRRSLGYGTPEEIREEYQKMGVEHPPELSKRDRERLKRAVREARRRAKRRAEASGMEGEIAEIYVEAAADEAHRRWLRKYLLKQGKATYPTVETFAEIQQRKMVSEFARAVIEFKHTVELMTRAIMLAHAGQTGIVQKELAPFLLMGAPGGRFAKARMRFSKMMMVAMMLQNYRHWFESGPLFDLLGFAAEATGKGTKQFEAYKNYIKGRSIFQNVALAAGMGLQSITGGKGFWGKIIGGGLITFGSREHQLRTESFILADMDEKAINSMALAVSKAFGREPVDAYGKGKNIAQGAREISEAFGFRGLGKNWKENAEKVKKAADKLTGPAKKIFDKIGKGMDSVGGAFKWIGDTTTLMKRGARTGGIGGAWNALKGQLEGTALAGMLSGAVAGTGTMLAGAGGALASLGGGLLGLIGGIPAWAALAGAGGLGWLLARRRSARGRRLALAYAQQGDIFSSMRAMGGAAIMGGLGTAALGTGLVAAGGQFMAQKYMGVGLITLAKTAFPMLFPLILGSMAVSTIVTLTRRVMDRIGGFGGLPRFLHDRPVAAGRKLGGWAGQTIGWLLGGLGGGALGAGSGYLLGSLITNDPRIRLAMTGIGALYGGYRGGKATGNWLGGIGSGAGGFGAGLTTSLLAAGGLGLLGKKYFFPGGGMRSVLSKMLIGTVVAPWLGKHVLGDDSWAANPLFDLAAMFLPELFWGTGIKPIKWVGKMVSPWLAKGWKWGRSSGAFEKAVVAGKGLLGRSSSFFGRTWFGRNLIEGTKSWIEKVPFLTRMKDAAAPKYASALEKASALTKTMVAKADEAAEVIIKSGAVRKASIWSRAGSALLKIGKWGALAALLTGLAAAGYGVYRWVSGRRGNHRNDDRVLAAGMAGPGSSGGSGGAKAWIYAALSQVLPVAITMLPINPLVRNVLGIGAGLGFGAMSLNQKGGGTAFATMQGVAMLLAMTRGGALKTLLSPRALIKEAGLAKGLKIWFDSLLKGLLGPDVWGFLKRMLGKFFGKMFGRAEVQAATIATEKLAFFASKEALEQIGIATAERGAAAVTGKAVATKTGASWLDRLFSAQTQIALAPFFFNRAGVENESVAATEAALREFTGDIRGDVIRITESSAPPISAFVAALKRQESEGLGGYKAVGQFIPSLNDRAYGAYQVMGNNIAPWLKKYAGIDLPKDQAIKLFMGNPQLQDYIVNAVIGERAQKLMSGAYGWKPKTAGELYRSLAASWYGDPNKWLRVPPDKLPTKEITIGDVTYPSLRGYTDEVIDKMKAQGLSLSVVYNINGPLDAESLKRILDDHNKNLKYQLQQALQELAN